MRSIATLSLKAARFELGAGLAIAAVVVGALSAVSILLLSMAVPVHCLEDPFLSECGTSRVDEWIPLATTARGFAPLVTVGAAVVVGILLGLPVVATEIESTVTVTAWWLARSRRRWLMQRITVFGAIATALLVVIAACSEVLHATLSPGTNTLASFDAYHTRGGVLVGYGLWAFAVSVCVGAIVGRILPTLVVALAATIPAGIAAFLLFAAWAQPVPLPTENGELIDPSAVLMDELYEDADGTQLTYSEVAASAPYAEGTREFASWFPGPYEAIARGYPGTFYGLIQTRELAAWIGLSAIALGVGVWTIRYRRPYP